MVAVVAVFVIALLAKWLRGMAVEDPHEELADSAADEDLRDADQEPVEVVEEDADDYEDAVDEEVEEDELEGDDELAALGVSPDDRLEFLERLADHGAIALVWTPVDPKQNPGFVQHETVDGTTTKPVFTSEKKALAYSRAIGPGAMGMPASYEPMPVDAAFLVDGDFEVVVNPRTPFASALTAEDRETLAALAGVEARELDELDPDGESTDPVIGD